MEQLERFARQHARQVAMTKTAGISDRVSNFLANKAAVGGAGAGAVIGGVQGARGSRENEKGYGALAGAAFGAISGGLLGAGARSLYKNVPAGFKGRKEGLEALEKEYMKANKIKVKPESGSKLTEFRDGLKKYRTDKLDSMRKAEDLAAAGKSGKEARDAIDAVRANKLYAGAGKFQAGKDQLYGGLIGGSLGVGYGGYTLANMNKINESADQERALESYLNMNKKASLEVAYNVGKMLAHY